MIIIHSRCRRSNLTWNLFAFTLSNLIQVIQKNGAEVTFYLAESSLILETWLVLFNLILTMCLNVNIAA